MAMIRTVPVRTPISVQGWDEHGRKATLTFHPESFGDRLKRLRRERNLTQTELARLSGVSQPVISEAERGRYASAGAVTVHGLARALRVSMNLLWSGEEDS